MTSQQNKEFLKISDMLDKMEVTRTQFWKMAKAGKVPPPVIKSPQRGLTSKVTELYEEKASRGKKI